MRYENKLWNREGDLFANRDEVFDLSCVKCLHSGIDTVKQLYTCNLKLDIIHDIQRVYDSGFDTVVEYAGIEWAVSKAGKAGGYQWILKNLDEGFVVLLKSFFVDEFNTGSHVKIEATPQRIHSCTPARLTDDMNNIARAFASHVVPSAVALHIAVDLHGVEIPRDFEYRLVTKAKKQMKFNGVSNVGFNLNEVMAVYGETQTYTFGSASGLQFQLYDKVTEAVKRDKICFWESLWVQKTNDDFEPYYQSGDAVKRLEMRFHHSVIQQFCNGTKDDFGDNIQINTFHDAVRHLTALWQYSLDNFRLQHSTSYIDPLWQKLIEDIQIFQPSPCLLYKRSAKPAGESTRRNTAMWLGNQLKLMARRGFTVPYATKVILGSNLEAELMDYFALFGADDRAQLGVILSEFIRDKFQKLRLAGIAS